MKDVNGVQLQYAGITASKAEAGRLLVREAVAITLQLEGGLKK